MQYNLNQSSKRGRGAKGAFLLSSAWRTYMRADSAVQLLTRDWRIVFLQKWRLTSSYDTPWQ